MYLSKFLLIGLFIVLFSAFVYATSVSSCAIINASGDYLLTTDLTGAVSYSFGPISSACITINTSNVYFDCDDYSFTNDGTSNAAGLLVADTSPLNNVTAINCISNGYAYGMYLSHVENSSFSNEQLHSNGYGMYAENTMASSFFNMDIFNTTSPFVQFSSSSYNNVTNSNFNLSSGNGILVSSASTHNQFTSNTVSNTSFTGIFVQSSSYNSVSNNNLLNTGNGIYFQFSSYGTIDNNSVQNSNGHNYYLYSSSYNNVTNNVGTNVYALNSFGIYLYSTSNFNNISSNNIRGSTAGLIGLSSSRNNLIDSNLLFNSQADGIKISVGFGSQPTNNSISNNIIQNITNFGIFASSATQNNFTLNILSNISGSALNITSSGYAIVSQNTISNTGRIGLYLNSANSQIIENTFLNLGSYGIYVDSNNGNSIISNNFSNISSYSILLNSSNSNLISNVYQHNTSRAIGIFDSDLTNLSGEIFYGEAPAIFISTLNLIDTSSFNLTDSIFAPSFGPVNYTNISIFDSVPESNAFTIGWANKSFDNYTSFENKFIEFENLSENTNTIDELSLKWSELELSGYEDEYFILMDNSSGEWANSNAVLSTTANVLHLTEAPIPATYGIFQNGSTPAPSDNNTSGTSSRGAITQKSINVQIVGSCNSLEFLVLDSSNLDPIKDAQVSISDPEELLSAQTNSAGKAQIALCKSNLHVFVHASGFTDYDVSSYTPICICQLPKTECELNSDCTLGQICQQNKCIQKTAECTSNQECTGIYSICSNQKCVECSLDSDCGQNMVCSNNRCQIKETPVECTKNTDCSSANPVCKTQKCVACTLDSDCGSGQICKSDSCVNIPVYDIHLPQSGNIGNALSIQIRKDGIICSNCEVLVAAPDGTSTILTTNEQGELLFTPSLAGKYQFSANGGAIVKEISVLSMGDEHKESRSASNPIIIYLLALVFLLLLLAAIYLLFRKS